MKPFQWGIIVFFTVCLVVSAQEGGPAVTRLSLEEFRSAVMAPNQHLAARRLDAEIGRVQARGERWVLEPALVSGVGRSRTERQNTVEQGLSQNAPVFIEDVDSASTGVEGRLPIGTTYWLGASLDNRSNNLTNAWVRTPFSDEYLGFAGVRVTQPLNKGAGRGSVLARIRIADIAARVSHQELRKQTMFVASRAEVAYWNLALAQHLLGLRNDSVRIAEQVLNDNRERVRAGKMAEDEVLEAEAGLARRRSQASEAAQMVFAMSNMVRSFLSGSPGDSALFAAADVPGMDALDADFSAAMTTALSGHPDYLSLQEVLDQEDVRVVYSEAQRWPQIDLTASYGLNGIGETMTDAFDQMGDAEFKAWSVGLEIRIPLGGGLREQSELAAARLRRRQALLELKNAETEIGNALDTAMRQVGATHEQAGHQQRTVEFYARLLESEMGRLEAGRSDSRRVLQVEQELVDARIASFQSLVDHRRAWLDWELAQGIFLDVRRLEPDSGP